MRFSPARLVSLATLVPALLLLAVVPGCAKQSEGERCGDEPASQNDDCADGLTCRKVNLGDNFQRCCYTDRVTDSRCEASSGELPSSSGGSAATAGGNAGGAGSGGSDASAAGGTVGGSAADAGDGSN